MCFLANITHVIFLLIMHTEDKKITLVVAKTEDIKNKT